MTKYDNRWSIGLIKKAGNWTWVSERPLNICKWGQGEPSGEHDVAFMYKLDSNGDGACLVAWRVQVGKTGRLVFVRFPRVS